MLSCAGNQTIVVRDPPCFPSACLLLLNHVTLQSGTIETDLDQQANFAKTVQMLSYASVYYIDAQVSQTMYCIALPIECVAVG